MNIRNRTILVLSLLAVSATVSAQSKLKMPAKGEPECAGWVSSSFAKGKTPPFSFVYDGKSSDSFISKWGYEKRELPSGEDNVNLTAYIYTDPATGLSVECKVKTFTDFNAMEWVLNFRNTSDKDTPEIRDVKVSLPFPRQMENTSSIMPMAAMCPRQISMPGQKTLQSEILLRWCLMPVVHPPMLSRSST